MDTAEWALIVAIGAFLVGAASLAWHVVAFVRSGHRVQVDAFFAFRYTPDPIERPVVLWISVRNVGRLPIDIVEIWSGVPADLNVNLLAMRQRGSPSNSAERLEIGSRYEIQEHYTIEEAVDAYEAERKVRVVLGNGRTESCPLPDPGPVTRRPI